MVDAWLATAAISFQQFSHRENRENNFVKNPSIFQKVIKLVSSRCVKSSLEGYWRWCDYINGRQFSYEKKLFIKTFSTSHSNVSIFHPTLSVSPSTNPKNISSPPVPTKTFSLSVFYDWAYANSLNYSREKIPMFFFRETQNNTFLLAILVLS